ncbi:MotA/TolQ/ExbB proton channel family protein [Rhodobacterales bacterium HKCCE2091]|nr:MotA/TolQ/ExbB proton channel family protein [Rhodobacterales bacterium HKCCE2091]
MADITAFLARGGPALWAIALLSVLALAVILWKAMHLARLGAWSGGAVTRGAVDDWCAGHQDRAIVALRDRRSMRGRMAHAAMTASADAALTADDAREETTRVARVQLAGARTGLRALDLIATIAPLLGLLGTVLGMIEAFQALQESGARADPAALAGGIWEALLTTAAGMSVAIPVQVALTWFESAIEGVQGNMEDAATRIFLVRRT